MGSMPRILEIMGTLKTQTLVSLKWIKSWMWANKVSGTNQDIQKIVVLNKRVIIILFNYIYDSLWKNLIKNIIIYKKK